MASRVTCTNQLPNFDLVSPQVQQEGDYLVAGSSKLVDETFASVSGMSAPRLGRV